jgi:hypothetical protein
MSTNYQTTFSVGRICLESATLFGVVILKTGEALGHQVYIDQKSLQTVLAACKREKSLRVRLDHQNSASAFIGTLSNYRIENDCIRADLELFKSSEFRDYVLEISQKMPDGFGLSLEFENVPQNINGRDYVRAKSISGVALVSDPAATTGLFSADGGLAGANTASVVPAIPSGHKVKGRTVTINCPTCEANTEFLSRLATFHDNAADRLDSLCASLEPKDNAIPTEAQFQARLEKQRLELEANLEKRASILAQRMIASTGVKLSRIPDPTVSLASGDGILSQLERIEDATEKGRFYSAHKTQIQNAFQRVAAKNVELGNKLRAEGTL